MAARAPILAVGRTAEVFAWGPGGQVLKHCYPDMLMHFAEQEGQISRVVSEVGLEAPILLGNVEVDGRAGLIFERIVGRSMLEAMAHMPGAIMGSARQFAQLHANMHCVRRSELPSGRIALEQAITRAAGRACPQN